MVEENRGEPKRFDSPNTESGPNATSLVGQILAEDFAILSEHANGKLLRTYLGKQITYDRLVYVTTLQKPDPKVDAQFEGQYYLSSRLVHENIAKDIAFFRSPIGQPFWVKEFCEGITLAELLDSTPRIEVEEEIAHTLLAICQALHCAHSNGIPHGELNPRNIMLVIDSTGAIVVKLINFGICAFESNPDIYTSPERISGAPPSVQSDIYSFGVISYRSITGRLPQRGEQPETLRYPPLSRLRDDLRCGEKLTKIIDEAMDPELEWRAETICEIDASLREWLNDALSQRHPADDVVKANGVDDELDSSIKQSVKEMMKDSVHNLLTLKSTQFSQEQTMMMKLTSTFAKKGPRQSPRKTLLQAIALVSWTLLFTGICVFFVMTRHDEIVDGFSSASHFLSTQLLGKSYYKDQIEQETQTTKPSLVTGSQPRSAIKRAAPPANKIMEQGNLMRAGQKRFKYEESQDFKQWLVNEEYGKLRRIDASTPVRESGGGNNK